MPIQTQNTPTPRLEAYSHTRRSCDELGLCQQRLPPCAGCNCFDSGKNAFFFAPGAIEGGPSTRPAFRRWGMRNGARWVAVSCLAMTVLASCSYSVGYISVLLGERL